MGNKKIKYTLIAVLIIIIAGIIIWRQNKQKEEFSVIPTSTPTLTPSPTPDEIANWGTYQNGEYGFEIKYPSDFEKAVWENFEFSNISGDFKGFLLVQLKIPSSFLESKFYFPDIRIEVDDKNVCDKLDQFPEVNEDLTTKEPLTIGNITFAKREKENTNPGVSYDKIIYYTINNNKCYSITLFNIISTSSIESLGNQDEIIKEKNKILGDKKKLISFLEQKILTTFKFLE